MEVPAPKGPWIYSNPSPKAVVPAQSTIPKAVTSNGWQYLILHGLNSGNPAFLFDSTLGSPLCWRGPGIAHVKQKNSNTEIWFCETCCRTQQCIRVTATLSLKYVNKTVSLFWQEIPLFETTKQKEQQPLRYSPHKMNFFFLKKKNLGIW